MASLLTNASAQTALRTLRVVQSNLQETQDRISTGLKVRSPKENPAFFLVAQTVKGDVAVLDGLKDNLTVGVNTAKTASAGLNGITEDINQIQSALTTAQTGTALNEVQFAIGQVVEQIEGQIDATSFNGVNLLAGTDTTTITTTITRDNGSFELSTFTLQGQNLDSIELAGVAQGAYTAAQAQTQFDSLYNAFNSGFADRLDVNGDGAVDLAGQTDSILTAEGGTEAANEFTFYGTQDDIDFLASVGITATNLGKIGSDTSQDVIQIADITAAPGAGAPLDYEASQAEYGTGTVTAGGIAFGSAQEILERAVFSDQNLRAFSNDSGFRAVARQIEVADPAVGNVQAGFVVADTLISRVNISATIVGVFESTLSSRQDFLSDLTDSLELGVAALTEADLTEESSRLQSFQVQEQLATQALSIANQRPQTLLSLFR
ncbi:flagellin N-terminal helical domain-containing protein [Parvularcula lutaonensis]|uniref:Flagellin n=3 Tax=Parvularcula lutaonensis TaxID=491923 RepID=A0ABV7MCG9_9PROT